MEKWEGWVPVSGRRERLKRALQGPLQSPLNANSQGLAQSGPRGPEMSAEQPRSLHSAQFAALL